MSFKTVCCGFLDSGMVSLDKTKKSGLFFSRISLSASGQRGLLSLIALGRQVAERNEGRAVTLSIN